MSLLFKANGQGATAQNSSDTFLSDLAAEAGFPLNMQCGGQGACRGCIVRLGGGRYRINGKETLVADGETIEARACRTVVLSEGACVEIPGASLLKIGSCSSADFYASRSNLFVPAADVKAGELGIAVDIGTTTVAALLVDLGSGRILARESAYNRQIELADNVASRIALCRDDAMVQKMQRLLVRDTLTPMFERMGSGGRLDGVSQIVFSGNTVMSHLALGLSALSIGTIPFEPLTRVFSEHLAPEIGLPCCPGARVRTVPAIAGYVGGDLVSDLYIAELANDRLELLVDIGTNGEIILNDHGRLLATATAAGPAFEGAGLLHGCRADIGVIEQITCLPDDRIEIETIGGQPATGLCGSAAVDFIATAWQTGLLNEMGRFNADRLRAAGRLVEMDCHGMRVRACRLVEGSASGSGEDVLITEYDVSQILKAKAAVYAGICTLVDRSGYRLADVERLVLAGGFAAHLRIAHAITVGLLPELPIERYDVVGNGSLAGAYAALGDASVFSWMLQAADQPESCHLAETDEFENRFIDALAIPNLDPDEFPETTRQRESG